MNCYGNLTRLKSLLNKTGTADDTDLLMLLNVASREVDKYCHQTFYTESRTRYYDGQGTYFDPKDNLLSISSLKTDEDGDGTYENTFNLTSTSDSIDCYLYPLNSYPKMWLEINSEGDYGGFASGVKRGVQVIGVFGYGESATPYADTAVDTSAALVSTDVTFSVTDYTQFAVGETILLDSEQAYITAVSTTATLTVTRAINGTTAAAHSSEKSIYLYQYPDAVAQATYIMASRLWKRKDSAYGTIIGEPTLGPIEVHQGLDPDVKLLLTDYRKTIWAR